MKATKRKNLARAIAFCQVSRTHPWDIQLPQFRLLVDSYGVTHPTWAQRSPGLTASAEEQQCTGYLEYPFADSSLVANGYFKGPSPV